MTVSFFIEGDDLPQLYTYLSESYDEDAENPVIYFSNTSTSPTSIMVSADYFQYNELIDLELIQLI